MSSAISRTLAEFGESIKDAYSQITFGDEPGMHETIVYIARPRPVSINDEYAEQYDLGMTFMEFDDRAFVNYVVPDSDAYRAGIRPQYCLQVATTSDKKFGGISNYDDECIQYALTCEKNGMRTTFKELKNMFEHRAINDSDHLLFTGKDNHPMKGDSPIRKGVLKKKLRDTTQEVVGRWSTFSINNVCSNVFAVSQDKPEENEPIFMVFRKTKGRQSILGNTHIALPSLRLDDECNRAANFLRRLLPTADAKHSTLDDAWNEIANGASTLLLNKEIISNNNDREASPEIFDTVETSTIRGMIKNAVGLAFVRASKLVLGLSFHVGSGIVISRLEDGSWSAPSAIGIYGAGVGFQFGLEVADYIFIIQTNEALNHFRKGTNYTFGGNMGAAVGGIGREAFGAASLSTKCGENGEEGNSLKLAPIVAYAKSQGLYFGVSLEGSKMFVREDINDRIYRFSTGKECSTNEILSGLVPPPSDAEDLYTTLHNVEFAHEISQLPRPPDILQHDSNTNWKFDTDNIFSKIHNGVLLPLYYLKALSESELMELNQFESKIKQLLYDGVSVNRVVMGEVGRGNESLERRTLWLMLPEVGSLRIGFLSKVIDGDEVDKDDEVGSKYSIPENHKKSQPIIGTSLSNDDMTLSSVDRSTYEERNLARKFTLNLSDIISVERYATTDSMTLETADRSRFIKIDSVDGKRLFFIANNVVEAVDIFCGLKLLIEKETARLGIRGGKRIDSFDFALSKPKSPKILLPPQSVSTTINKSVKSADTSASTDNETSIPISTSIKSPSTSITTNCETNTTISNSIKSATFTDIITNEETGKSSPTLMEDIDLAMDDSITHSSQSNYEKNSHPSLGSSMINSSTSHSSVSSYNNTGEFEGPADPPTSRYIQGKALHTEIASNVAVPIPLPLCRALFLDSSSPLIKKWELDRGDIDYVYGEWNFQSDSPRSTCQPYINTTESALVAGKMVGGCRNIAFRRVRNGQKINGNETWGIDIDEADKFMFTIAERTPRRGFSIKVWVVIRPSTLQSCEISMVGEFVPLSRNTQDQAKVHRAFELLLSEVHGKYGQEGRGLLSGLLKINHHRRNIEAMKISRVQQDDSIQVQKTFNSTDGVLLDDKGWVEFNKGSESDSIFKVSKPEKKVKAKPELTDQRLSQISGNIVNTPLRKQKKRNSEKTARPSTPSIEQRMEHEKERRTKFINSDTDFVENSNPIKIDVKPLPKLRLDLMPSPREADEMEENDSM